jgi:CBS domain-containing protein
MRCEEIMKTDLITCGPEDPVSACARIMRDLQVGFVPICDQSRRVLGVLTDRDITTRVVAEERSPHTACREVMTREVYTCYPDDDLNVARRLMEKNHVARMCCVDELGSLTGVISLSDVIEACSSNEASETMRRVVSRET